MSLNVAAVLKYLLLLRCVLRKANMYWILSTFTARPAFLLAYNKACAFLSLLERASSS